ncbi:Bisdemethoxycurcumin synthase [Zea mays]|uniref:Bisdemethoxycurcumin synthase n=1 Tax=Zea mays TaxID=4577 RepID=A0A3L6G587_MAIZE|nr:Bisdemethoxycurcumin synthase [Zea mays]
MHVHVPGEMTGVKRRYVQVDEDLLREHPEFLDPAAASLPSRLAVVAAAMPGLVAAAAAKAIAEWGRPATDITHLVFSTSTSVQVPAVDLRVASLLGLPHTVRRTTLCSHACTGSSGALRVAKDVAETSRGARVLVACADMLSVLGVHAPHDDDDDAVGIVAHALFGDGAGAVLVGADPWDPRERPVFQMVAASQATVPGTEHVVSLELASAGVAYRIEAGELAALVGANVERCLSDAMAPLAAVGCVGAWNDLFWVLHPGGPIIMDSFAAALGLQPGKLAASRRVLSEYGNMMGPTLIFVLDEVIRRRRQNHQDRSCGWGFMVGLGPGFTIEVMALRACGDIDNDKSTLPPTPRLKSSL